MKKVKFTILNTNEHMEEKVNFKISNLDSIRSIAFLSTFFAHAFYTESLTVEQSTLFRGAIYFREVFSFGVPIFFVLSGFLITFLMLKEQESVGFNIGKFYMRRLLRIWPLYFIILIIGFIIFPIFRTFILHQPYEDSANPIYYVLFLSNFDQINNSALPFGIGLGPTWSVSIEEQFYLIWPLLLLLFKKKKFIYPILILIACSLILVPIFHLQYKHTIYNVIYLSIGGLFAYFSFYHKSILGKIVNISNWLLVGIVLLLMVIMYFHSLGYRNYSIVFGIAIIVAYLIIYQAFSNRLQLNKIPFLERMGKYTYGLYLYHVICNFIAHILIDDMIKMEESPITSVFIRPLISLVLSIIISVISYRTIEKYFFNLKHKFSNLH